jgi:hypothetical protein
MRTTLDIDHEVLAAAKELAKRAGKTTGEVVSELLRRALTEGPPAAAGVEEAAPVYGFRPFPPRGGVVTDERIERLREQEGI